MEPFIPAQIQRTDNFKLNSNLTDGLKLLNGIIGKEALSCEDSVATADWNGIIFLIMGPARSGTTFMLQTLQKKADIFVPTNFISRFYNNLPLGAVIQSLITNSKFNYKDEMFDLIKISKSIDYNLRTDYGKTKGAFNVHTCWYFWKTKFTLPSLCTEFNESKENEFKTSFHSAITDIKLATQFSGQRAACFKANFLTYNINWLANFKNIVPVYIDRDYTAFTCACEYK